MKTKRIFGYLAAAGAAVLFSQCELQLAGSSVGTGNPTEMKLGFAENGSPTSFTGKVDLFGSTQIPVPGFDTLPLASFQVDGKQELVLGAKDLKAIPMASWPKGSREGDSLFRFNLVATGTVRGAILAGLVWKGSNLVKGGFAIDSQVVKRDNGKAGIDVGLRGLVEFRGRLPEDEVMPEMAHFLFIYGTGYFTEMKGNEFAFQGIPEDKIAPAFIRLPLESSSSGDSTFVYGFKSSLNAGTTDTLEIKGIVENVPIPKN